MLLDVSPLVKVRNHNPANWRSNVEEWLDRSHAPALSLVNAYKAVASENDQQCWKCVACRR